MNEHEPRPAAALPDVPASLVVESGAACQTPAKDGKRCETCLPCRTAWTAREAIAEWNLRAVQLHALGVLTEWDTSAFEAYCRAWARYLNAEWKIAQQGEVLMTRTRHPIQNPYRSVANRALSQCQQFWAEFGMMPSSRSRIGAKAQTTKAGQQAAKRRERFFGVSGNRRA